MQRTNIELDEKLVRKAMRLTKHRTKKDLVNHLLRDFVEREEWKELIRLRGKVKWNGNLNRMRKSRVKAA
jgi:Arc/MetJ family transcription regulator